MINLSLTRKRTKSRPRNLDMLPDSSYVKIGVLEGTGLHKGWGSKPTASTAEIAWWNEFGTTTIPERPFLRTTWAQQIQGIKRDMEAGAKKALLSDTPRTHLRKVLSLLGMQFADDLKKQIDDWTTPPNAVSTQLIKGNKVHLPPGTLINNPLVDTGELKNSIQYVVKSER